MASKHAGQPLMGVMFWQAALSSLPDFDGYNIYIDGGAAAGRKLLMSEAGAGSVRSVIRGSFGDEEEQGLMRRIVGLVTGQGNVQEAATKGSRQMLVVQVRRCGPLAASVLLVLEAPLHACSCCHSFP